jgi:hypothetical protein
MEPTALVVGAPSLLLRRVNPSVQYSPSPKLGKGRDGGYVSTAIVVGAGDILYPVDVRYLNGEN